MYGYGCVRVFTCVWVCCGVCVCLFLCVHSCVECAHDVCMGIGFVVTAFRVCVYLCV